jgi:hypothetical protein
MGVALMAKHYKMSFTSGGLLAHEAEVAAGIYLNVRDWTQVQKLIVNENAFQARTVTSGVRVAREVVQRLTALTEDEISLVVDSSATDRGYLLWLAACRQYDFIGEFAEEVVRERFLLMNPQLSSAEFDSFIREKALWHEELEALSDSTVKKLRTNLFLMLRTADLLSSSGEILSSNFSPRMSRALPPSDIRFFPVGAQITRGM